MQYVSVISIKLYITGYRPDYRCVDPYENWEVRNITNSYVINKCDITVTRNVSNVTEVTVQKCPDGYTYSLPNDRTFVTEVNIIMSRMLQYRNILMPIYICTACNSTFVTQAFTYQNVTGVTVQIFPNGCTHSL